MSILRILACAALLGAAPADPPDPISAAAGQLGDVRAGARLGQMLGVHNPRDLDLSPGQRAVVRQVMERHELTLSQSATSVWDARETLHSATRSLPVDSGAVRIAADELGRQIGDTAIAVAALRADVRDVLTPEQAQKLDELRTAADERHGHARGMRSMQDRPSLRGQGHSSPRGQALRELGSSRFAGRRAELLRRARDGELDIDQLRERWRERFGPDSFPEDGARDAPDRAAPDRAAPDRAAPDRTAPERRARPLVPGRRSGRPPRGDRGR